MTIPFSFVGPEISGGGGGTYPTESQVLNGVTFGPTDNLTGNVVLPAVGDVEDGVTFGASSALVGTFGVPTEAQVQSGVGFGANDTEFTGTNAGTSSAFTTSHSDNRLEIVQRADYTSTSAIGPVRVAVPTTFSGVSAGDTVRFGATEEDSSSTIAKTGIVVDVGGTLYAQIQLSRTDLDVVASQQWRYEIQHETSGGDVSPIVVNAELWIAASHAEV